MDYHPPQRWFVGHERPGSDPKLRLVIAQLNLLVGDIAGNTRSIIDAAVRARDHFSAQAVVFPELALTGYPPQDLLLRNSVAAAVETALAQLMKDVSGIDLIVGFPRRAGARLFNAVAVLRDGQCVAEYHKRHLPNYSVFDEKRYFEPGDNPCVVDIGGIPVGLVICEDIWLADAAARSRDAGARLLIVPNASPFHAGKWRDREQVLAARVAETGLPVVYANLVGGQDELVFDGESMVMTLGGEICLRAPAFVEGLFPIDIDVDAQGRAQPGRAGIEPTLSHLQSIYGALVLGVRDYITKNGFSGAVIGLSGGIDSALTLAITVDAIGARQVEAVMMPSRFTAAMSLEDAAAEAVALGVEYHVLPIEAPFTSFLDTLAGEFTHWAPDVTEENIQARCRMILLMAISNKKQKVVITTGNKSEMAVGYTTLYGDMAGGYSALKDVPKGLVYELARYRNGLSPVIPQRVIERPPSAELRAGQRDDDSLPPYPVLDQILELYVEQDRSSQDIIAAGFDAATVRRVVALVNRNEYKRRQAAPGVRITRKAFGQDRRYPITSGYDKN